MAKNPNMVDDISEMSDAIRKAGEDKWRQDQFTKIAFDVDKMQPGCVLIQAALGCNSEVAKEFDTEDWLTHMTPGMKVYELKPGMLKQLIFKTRNR
jgi:hypothetical protein